MGEKTLISILGPTACGKTHLAVKLALALGGEILSADSRQVYRGMDIGTGKDLNEYSTPSRRVPYHLIDIREAGEQYSLFDFQRDFHAAYHAIRARGAQPILCGGSGLYAEAILRNFRLQEVPPDPGLRAELEGLSDAVLMERLRAYVSLHNSTDTTSRKRLIRALEIAIQTAELGDKTVAREAIPIGKTFAVGIPRALRRQRISERLEKRLEEGLVEEVVGLQEKGVTLEMLEYYGLEYRYVGRYTAGAITLREMHEGLERAIHQFAKRQMTFLRGLARRGVEIEWLDGTAGEEAMVGRMLEAVKEGEKRR